MSYEAIVCKLSNVRKHPNADRLMLADAHGHQIVTGSDVVEGTLGIFFPTDGQLSEEYAAANDCVGYTDLVTREKKGGYFGKNRRVRSQKFRGEQSEGYFAPLESLAYTKGDYSSLVEGTTLTELNGIAICNKYITPATLKAQNGGTPKTRREYKTFPKHIDTVQFKFIDEVPEQSIIWITEKLHGTSGRFGYVADEVQCRRTIFDRLLSRQPRVIQAYTYLKGTRNVVIGDSYRGFYGSEQFRYDAVKELEGRLHKDEVLYFELVGYTNTGQSIMGEQDLTKLSDKSLVKQYGKRITYKYGCQQGETRLYVYRITNVNEDGHQIDLSWNQVKARCKELGLNHVPELAGPIVLETTIPLLRFPPFEPPYFEDLKYLVDHLLEGPSTLDESHIREGVVLRVESEYETAFIKSKSFTFGLLEGYLKEKDDFVDMEEAS